VLERLGRFAARHHWWFIGAWIVVAVGLIVLSGALKPNTVDNFTIPGTESQTAANLLAQDFPQASGASGTLVFQAPSGQKLTDPANAAVVQQVVEAVDAVDGVEPIIPPSFPNATAMQVAQFSGKLSADETIAYFGIQLTDSASEIAKTVEDKNNIWDQLNAALAPAQDAGMNVQIGGQIADIFNIPQSALSDHADDIGLALAVIILLVALGTVVSMLVPIGVALFGVAVSSSLVIVLEHRFEIGTIAPILGIMLGLGVGIDYSLFIVSRFRQALAEGKTPEEATGRALTTSGSAVLFAGITVCLAMIALGLMGVPYVRTLGLVAALFVIVVVVAALTFLPALLGALGNRINKAKMPWHHRTVDDPEAARKSLSAKWAHEIARYPYVFAPISLVVLLLLAAPLLRIDTGFPDDGSAPADTAQRKAYDLISEGFGPGANGPLLIVAQIPSSQTANAEQLVNNTKTKLQALDDVQLVNGTTNAPDNTVAIFEVIPKTGPDDPQTTDLVRSLRSTLIPEAVAGTGLDASDVYVGGQTAVLIDLTERINSRLFVIIATVLGGSFLLLMMVFRSLFIPLKAVIMNLLSIGASYGVLVAVFNWGWGKGLIGLDETVTIAPFVPVMMFAILFGLSMDYEVFLLSRIREEYLKSGDSHESVVVGVANTARVITAAASIMIAVFLSYVTNPDATVKMIGLGLAVAVFVDATIVRMVLVPSTMELMGKANWWLPHWLDKLLPHINVDTPEPEPVTTDPEPVGTSAG
jgi:RND superfamily putative drug exporter